MDSEILDVKVSWENSAGLAQNLTPFSMRLLVISVGQMYLLFGKGGWICGLLTELLTKQGKSFKIAESRMENREAVARYVDGTKGDFGNFSECTLSS